MMVQPIGTLLQPALRNKSPRIREYFRIIVEELHTHRDSGLEERSTLTHATKKKVGFI